MEATFTANTRAELEQQMRDYLGLDAVVPVPAAPSAKPLPAGAPLGAHWVAMPGAPMLQGLDGKPIAVEWVGGVPRLAVAQ